MTETMNIPMGERGVIRLFSLDMPPDEIETFAEADAVWGVKEALGAETLDHAYVEVFDAGDVAEIGLTNYLMQGAGIPEGEIAGDRARLDALKGPLLIVTSGAFGQKAQTLHPAAPLRWQGTWHEEREPVQFEPLPDASAHPQPLPGHEHADHHEHETPTSPRRGRAALVALGLVVLVFIVLTIWHGGR